MFRGVIVEMMDTTTTIDARWRDVAERNKAADGAFVYGVSTTGIFCRPSCSSRLPRQENVEFFAIPAQASAAGYRPCKRCHPAEAVIADNRLALAQQVCDFIATHIDDPERLTLDQLGAHFHYAPQHIQSVFADMLHMTPRQYAEALRMQNLKSQLREHGNVTDAIYGAGYGSTSRVYERADANMGMTPAQYINQGKGITITYTVTACYLGALLVGATERGICAVGIYDDASQAEAALRAEYARADVQHDDAQLNQWVAMILEHLDGGRPALDFPLDIQATAFQWKVWDALRRIPRGQTRTYSQVAAEIGQPTAVRAVASACAHNHAAIVIPCHRVVGKNGQLSGYKWGVERKQRLLENEAR